MTFDPSSREAEAQAEIASTRLGGRSALALMAGFLLLLALGPSLEAFAALFSESKVLAPMTLDAERIAAKGRGLAVIEEIERRFDERSELVRWLRPRIQEVLTRFLGYGNERAVVGRHGWLFFRDDVDHVVSRRNGSEAAGDPAREIVAFRRELGRRGVALLVVATPVKPTIHPDQLARRASAPIRRTGETASLAEIARQGVEVLDLTDRFAREAARAPLYLATDTHWRPEGVEIAAREIALRLRELDLLPPGESEGWQESALPQEGRGDVAALLGLPAGSRTIPSETVLVHRVLPAASSVLRGSPPVLLLGDSFSGIYSVDELHWGTGAGLADRLAYRLGLPVGRLIRNAGGASATREALAAELTRDAERLAGVRVVVWQFAMRELSRGAWRAAPLPPPPSPVP